MPYPYDASWAALVDPARDGAAFPAGRPATESALCAEMARLAYAPFEREPGAATAVRASLARAGFSSCAFIAAGGTQGFLATDPVAALAVLVFRGTEPVPRDLKTDLNTLPTPWPAGGMVHGGFAEALGQVWPAVSALLVQVAGRLLFTGHSLGSALATLAASRHPPHALYTFGCPRVGDETFTRTLAATPHHRFANCCDIVCRVPPEAFHYRHAGDTLYLDRTGALHRNPVESVVRRDRRRARWHYARHWMWRRGTVWSRDAADHAPVNYVAAVTHLADAVP